MPLQIYLAESPCTLEQLADQVNDQLARIAAAAWSWSAKASTSATLGEVKDSFGHTLFSSSQLTVAQAVVNYLNQVGLAAKGAARGNVPGTDQRHAMAYASTVDLEEAYRERADGGAAGGRRPERLHGDDPAQCRDRSTASATTRCRWPKWPTASGPSRPSGSPKDGCDVTDDFVRYAKPLVGDDMLTLPLVDGR